MQLLRANLISTQTELYPINMDAKQQQNQTQIWMLLMVVPPAMILYNISSIISPEGGFLQIVYSGLFGGIGGLLGSGAFVLTKNRSKLAKVIAAIALVAIACAALMITRSYY